MSRHIQHIQQHRTDTATKMQNPPEKFPLQGGRGQEDGTVVVSIVEHPKDYIVWSMASLICGNPLCLGLWAFYFSVKVSSGVKVTALCWPLEFPNNNLSKAESEFQKLLA
ncbi:hypothetical protein NFI96_027934, partial [Prochilodus magdalenae]